MEITLEPISYREDWQSPKIMHLKDQLKKGQNDAIQTFWKQVQKEGTPLLEPADEDTHLLVTFLWKAVKPHKNVVVSAYGLGSFDPLKNKMTHIEGTDIWYRTYRYPKNLRTVYSISPDDPLISIADYRLELSDFSPFTANWTNDIFNPIKYFMPASLCLGSQDHEMSLLELPDAPKYPWAKSAAPQGKVFEDHVPSKILDLGRDVYVYLPAGYNQERKDPYPLLVAFDGLSFRDHYKAPAILDYLIANGKIEPLVAVMILNPDPNPLTRGRDLPCYDPFCDFVGQELITWARQKFRVTSDPHKTVVTGASMGGLASVYQALCYPHVFGNVLSQSGVFWWPVHGEADWLIHQYVDSPKLDLQFFLDAGILETVPTFCNGCSILNTNKYMRDVLKAKGYPVSYVEFAGGHDYICWQETFALGIEHLLANA